MPKGEIVGMFTGTTMMCLSLMARTHKKDKLRRRSDDGNFTGKNSSEPNLKYVEMRKCRRGPNHQDTQKDQSLRPLALRNYSK
jgi:hypothetical protein